MDKELEDILTEMESVVTDARQMSIVEPDYGSIEKVCAKFLKLRNYGVHSPYVFAYKIKKLDDLVLLFHNLYRQKFPEHINLPVNEKKDRKIASAFIKGRMIAAGLSRHAAMQQCGEIIRTVFEHYEEFHFEIPLTFGVFGQQNLIWVTTKAVTLMNKKIEYYEDLRNEASAEKTMEWWSKHNKAGWAQERIDKLHKKYEGGG